MEEPVLESTEKFKTRTIFQERANGSQKGVWLIAADFGYSSVKVFSQNCIASFPSFARPFSGEILGTVQDNHILYRDLDTGDAWLVGEAAQNEIVQDDMTVSGEALFGRTRYDDPMFKVLVRTGLGIGMTKNQYGDPAGRAVYVQTGLPSTYLKQDSKLLSGIIAGHHHFSLKIGRRHEQAFDFTIEKQNIDVMDQPKGTLMSVCVDNSHHFIRDSKQYFSKNVLIFDAGFGTLDIFPIKNNHVSTKQTFPEYSMKEVFSRTISMIEEKYGTEVSIVGMQKCLGDGYVRVHEKFSSSNRLFGDMLEKASHDVCDEALEKLAVIYRLYEYDYLIVTGGTGAAWNAQIRDKLKGLSSLVIVDGNQNDTTLPFLFANARGYYNFLYMKVERLLRP